jgi:hypothetical protein
MYQSHYTGEVAVGIEKLLFGDALIARTIAFGTKINPLLGKKAQLHPTRGLGGSPTLFLKLRAT